MAPRREIDKLPVQPFAATSNLRDFLVEQNSSFRFSNGHSLSHVSDDIVINTFDLATFAGREGERYLNLIQTLF